MWPIGATAGYDDFQPFAGAGETKTCKESLDNMTKVDFEARSDLCESVNEIKILCCPDDDSAPSGSVGFLFITIDSTLALFLVCKTSNSEL
jgi:hypothetical protein